MASKNYYDILGVDKNASDKDIKKAYHKLSIQYHPDKQVGKSDAEKKAAEEKFKEISEAYGVLSDEGKKRNYDQYGDPNGMQGGFGGFEGFGGAPFGDMFSSMFTSFNEGRRNRGGAREEVVEPGSNIQMRIPLTLEEIYCGCTKKLKYQRDVRCSNCHGKGGFKEKVCPKCHGTGVVQEIHTNGFSRTVFAKPCTDCGGTGHIVEEKCPTCGGRGFVKADNVVSVTFGAGTPEGFAYQVKDAGNESKSPRGKNGDFYAFPVYNFDQNRYMVKNLDIVEQIYLPYYDLLLGTEYIHELPDKSTVKINIPPCIPEDDILRINKKGIKGVNRVGDYYLQIHYQLPISLSDAERKHIEELKKLAKK